LHSHMKVRDILYVAQQPPLCELRNLYTYAFVYFIALHEY